MLLIYKSVVTIYANILRSSTATMMKCTSALFAILAIIGLGQAHQLPDFGSGPLHEDIQDYLDLVPLEEAKAIVLDYISEDPQVQDLLNFLLTSTVLKDLMTGFEAIPETTNLLNYMQREGVDIYSVINEANKALGMDEITPPFSRLYSPIIQKTGGVKGLFEDIEKLISFDKFIRTYVHKMKTSPAHVNLVNQLKSNNFQQLVNKVYQINSFNTIVDKLKSSGVNTQIVADLMYIVLGITAPNDITFYQERTLEDEIMDFVQLIPVEQFTDIVIKYVTEDQKVRQAIQFMFTSEFQSILRDVEALKEYQAVVTYLENIGLKVIEYIQMLHQTIGMEDYVPPKKIESVFKSQIGIQKIGDGMKGMLKDIYNILPIDKFKTLYEEKLQNSKVFANFIKKLTSQEMQKLSIDLRANQTFRNFITVMEANGWELQEMPRFTNKVFGIEIPY